MLESLSHVSSSLAPVRFPLPSAALPSFPADTESVRNTLRALRVEQNAQDRAHDMADLHRHMLTALAANDDNAMIAVLQIARSEMPDAIRTLERALEHLCENEPVDAEESTTALPSQEASLEPGNTGASHDTLDREFIVTGIDALRRLSKGADLGLPSWTITQFEVELEERVGFGSFSEVFRGTWRKHTFAVKVLDKTTPRKIFLREVKIWKSLHHPNVLELFGASSASGEPPWFLVRDGLSFLIYFCLSEVGFV
jgi:abelson tyrosine-protein kinase 1